MGILEVPSRSQIMIGLVQIQNKLEWLCCLNIQGKHDIKETVYMKCESLGPVVQSVVSLMSSLRVILLTVLADSIYSIMIFFAEKM